MDIVTVIKCPHCGDTWATNDNLDKFKHCDCFVCGCNYTPTETMKMEYFVYQAFKNCKPII